MAVTDGLPSQLPEALRRQAKIAGTEIYVGDNPQSPQVGDLRVTFRVLGPGPVSLIARQVGNTFEPYRTHAGGTVHIITSGTQSADSLFKAAQAENRTLTWTLRLVGLVVMFIGTTLLLRPLVVFADVIPVLGTIVEAGVGFTAGIIALFLSVGIVAIAWIQERGAPRAAARRRAGHAGRAPVDGEGVPGPRTGPRDCPRSSSTETAGPAATFARCGARACQAAGVAGALYHNLRWPAVRNMDRAGVSHTVAIALSGHKTASVYRRYRIVDEDDLRDALARTQASLATRPGGTVTPIPEAVQGAGR